MKAIIQRGLPLTNSYCVIEKMYIPLEESCGHVCDNCGKIIANIAVVKNLSNNIDYNIGFDCLETILINNQLLSGKDIEEYQKVKKMIPKILRFAKSIKETLGKNSGTITGLKFEPKTYESDFFPFYWLVNNQETSRNNDYVKLKEVDYEFLLLTLKNIFPNFILFKRKTQDTIKCFGFFFFLLKYYLFLACTD